MYWHFLQYKNCWLAATLNFEAKQSRETHFWLAYISICAPCYWPLLKIRSWAEIQVMDLCLLTEEVVVTCCFCLDKNLIGGKTINDCISGENLGGKSKNCWVFLHEFPPSKGPVPHVKSYLFLTIRPTSGMSALTYCSSFKPSAQPSWHQCHHAASKLPGILWSSEGGSPEPSKERTLLKKTGLCLILHLPPSH